MLLTGLVSSVSSSLIYDCTLNCTSLRLSQIHFFNFSDNCNKLGNKFIICIAFLSAMPRRTRVKNTLLHISSKVKNKGTPGYLVCYNTGRDISER